MTKVTARRGTRLTHTVTMREHQLTTDEPRELGGEDDGPTPQELLAASLASCTAITMEMYAQRKGWEIGPVEVGCEFTPSERGAITKFSLVLRLPADLSDEQVSKLAVIATKCPIHRVLDGEVMFTERIERVTLTA